jgi:MFS family permease
MVTESLMAVLAVALWLVVLSDVVELWMIYAFAFALGLITVVDEPARSAFVEEMVGRDLMPNAIGLGSGVRNSARITGPALAGLLIATVGASWVFFTNAVSFFAVVLALGLMRASELTRYKHDEGRPKIREGLRIAWATREIRSTILLVGVVGTLVYNFPTFLTLLAKEDFGGGAGLAGFLMAMLGVGTVIGALLAAHRGRSSRITVIVAAVMLGSTLLVAAWVPSQFAVEAALIPVGALAVFFGTSANSHMQLATPLFARGRVMAIYMLLTLGSTVVGGPFVGWVCEQFSPRIGFGFAGACTLAVATFLLARTAVHAPSTLHMRRKLAHEPTATAGD